MFEKFTDEWDECGKMKLISLFNFTELCLKYKILDFKK